METLSRTRLNINVSGIVQGVGFRPFIYNLARRFDLTGFVTNTSGGVYIEAEGDPENLNEFVSSIKIKAPPLSDIVELKYCETFATGTGTFEIKQSEASAGNKTLISPDVSICGDCQKELFDPADRRYLYPFINCTNCGPRLTIIEDIPYDRKFTTMKNFLMCPECKTEYNDPNNRRFHAQPNACSLCGPKVWFEKFEKIAIEKSTNWIEQTIDFLSAGKIIALKGLGGFHLAVDAKNNSAVQRLRERKGREAKPFAIMLPDLETVKEIAELSTDEEKILTSYQRPILLLKKKQGCQIAESVAPNNSRLGIMLPYTPLHCIIFHELKSKIPDNKIPALVMTSANFSEEPIAITNEGAVERLSQVADAFVTHNRDILIRADDSVSVVINNKPRILRRSRGFVPRPVFIKKETETILAVGAELKNTVCLLKNRKAFLSQHIGDLTNLRAFNFFEQTISHLQNILDAKAEYTVRDLHPDYLSSRWAAEQTELPCLPIQHHHAHMASCMAENQIYEPVIGIILDGTGYGYDNTIWGGEVLVGDYLNIIRFAHLEQIPLPGGDAAAKEPWRIAVSYLYHAFDGNFPRLEFLEKFPVSQIEQMLSKNFHCPLTSSTGRLFDAVAAMAGGPTKIRYEAEAAIHLMQAVKSLNVEQYEYSQCSSQNKKVIPLKSLIREIFNDVQEKIEYSIIAAKFHSTLAQIFSDYALAARDQFNMNKIVLSGGVFQNEIFTQLLENKLKHNGFDVFTHLSVPANDGGIALGQAVAANELINQKLNKPIIQL